MSWECFYRDVSFFQVNSGFENRKNVRLNSIRYPTHSSYTTMHWLVEWEMSPILQKLFLFNKWKIQLKHCFVLRRFKSGFLAYWVKYYIAMEGISCCLDFDPIHQSDWLGVYLCCAGSLPNFDHCGKQPCSIIPSSVILSEAMWAAIHLSLTPFPVLFVPSVRLLPPSIFPSRPSSASAGRDRQMGNGGRGVGLSVPAFLQLQEVWQQSNFSVRPTTRKHISQTGTVNLECMALTGSVWWLTVHFRRSRGDPQHHRDAGGPIRLLLDNNSS